MPREKQLARTEDQFERFSTLERLSLVLKVFKEANLNFAKGIIIETRRGLALKV